VLHFVANSAVLVVIILIVITVIRNILGSDSPKKIPVDKGPAPNPPLSGEAQLKYENDRLKLALAQSSANAKVNLLDE
jgi:hypothetical protein